MGPFIAPKLEFGFWVNLYYRRWPDGKNHSRESEIKGTQITEAKAENQDQSTSPKDRLQVKNTILRQ